MVSQAPPNGDGNFDSPASGGPTSTVPPQDRLYINADGTIPGTEFTVTDLNLTPFTGPKHGQFIDKRALQTHKKAIFEQHHAKAHANVSYGGIIVNSKGEILMRQPSDPAYGGELTLPKGGPDKGETPQQTALREVLEETGMKCKITSTVPGHYNSSGKSNQFFLMEVEEDTGKFDDETKGVEWLKPDDAYKKLGENETDTTKRDIDAISAAMHHHKEQNRRKDARQKEQQASEELNTSVTGNVNEFQKIFGETGKLPEDFTTNPKWKPLLFDLAHHISQPRQSSGLSGNTASIIKGMASNAFGELDKKFGFDKHGDGIQNLHDTFMSNWGGNSMGSHRHPNWVAHTLAKEFNMPETYFFGVQIPPSIDSSGEATFRSPEDRQAYIKAYDEWKEGTGEATGDLPSGETYNFDVKKKLSGKYKSTKSGVAEKEYDAWDYRYQRDKKIEEMWATHGIQQKFDSLRNLYGTTAKAANPENFPDSMSTEEAGQKMADMYVNHHYDLTTGILNAVYPDTTHYYLQRKVNKFREIAGDYGPTGAKSFSETDLNKLGFPTKYEEKENSEGFKAYIHSGALSGYSQNPEAYEHGQKHVIWRKANKRDFFAIPAITNTGHPGEQESIIMNNPDSEARIIFRNGNIHNGDWDIAHDNNGIHPRNVFGDVKKVTRGVTDSTNVYSDLLKKTTSADMEEGIPTGQLGSNPGGTYKDAQGNYFYVKTDYALRAANEHLANKLYEAVGINVPKTEIVKWKDSTALKSDWLKGVQIHSNNPNTLKDRADIKQGFLIDAVLANRDFAGANYDNLGEHDGKFYRLDQGGALEYRAQGKKKNSFHDWRGKYLSELDGFTNPTKNAQSSEVFSNMSNEDYEKATSTLVNLKNSTITDIVNSSAIEGKNKAKMIDTLIKRRDNALEWAIEKGFTGYNSLEDVHKNTKILKADEEEEISPSLYVDEPQSERYAWTEKEKEQVDKNWQDLADYYETEE